MILVVTHYQDRDYHDAYGKVTERAGTYVSHGIDTESGRTVILPCERWENFRHKCISYEGEWYLK
jgi:hypothetical protein